MSQQPNLSNAADRLSSAVDVSRLVADLGPAVTSNPGSFRSMIQQLPNQSLDEQSVASLLSFFCKTGSPAPPSSSSSPSNNNNDNNNDGLSAALVSSLINPSDSNSTNSNGSSSTSPSSSSSSPWNYDVVARVFAEDYNSLNWGLVAASLDIPEFLISDLTALAVLLKLYRAGAGPLFTTIPHSALFAPWRNHRGQVSLLSALVNAPPELYIFSLSDVEREDAMAASMVPNKGWGSVDLLRKLLMLSDQPLVYPMVRSTFGRGLMSSPEVLMIALVRAQQGLTSPLPGIKLCGELMVQLLPLFFKPGRNSYSGQIIKRLWEISPKVVVAGCVESWRSVASSSPGTEDWMGTVMHIVGIIRLLGGEAGVKILSGGDVEYVLSIAFVAGDKDVIKLETFLNEKVKSDGMQFAFPLIAFVGKNYMNASPRSDNPPISIENIATALKTLSNCDKNLQSQPTPNNNTPLSSSIKALTEACIAKHPALAQTSSSSDEIEEMANSYFQKIYTSDSSIGDVIEMLKRFKTSESTREQDIFACMIHNLFDEYRFFHKYPDKELRITGILFGTLIQHQLVSSITLGIALRYVLEALRKAPVQGGSGKMFRFGMYALEQFKTRLHEWPQYCSHVVQIPHLKQSHGQLVAEIEAAMNKAKADVEARGGSSEGKMQIPGDISSNLNPALNQPASNPNANPAQNMALAAAPSLDPAYAPTIPTSTKVAVFGVNLGRAVEGTSVEAEHAAPPDNISDRVQFLINNLSMSNLDQKVAELRDFMPSQFFGWLGNYLVVKRISTQPNFHPLYLALLDKMGDYGRALVESILQSVYLNVGKLLRSPKITTSTSERSLLKNLGQFLGAITLSRNKPILQRMLNCKELLYQGYETGRLIAVTPFVAKILEGAKNSIVFKPPNPWVMGLMAVFRGLYDVDDLKMNIKFEVEVLCKTLNVKLEEIERREDLKTRITPNKEKNPDFNIKAVPTLPGAATIGGGPQGNDPSKGSSNVDGQAGGNFSDQTVIPNLAAYVSINPSLLLFNTNAALKRVVPVAVDRAIREIIQPVVERSVTIACITTKELVIKDFAMESDEIKMRKAAQLMVSNLAGSLALVTCKEPLRASVATHLRNLLQSTITTAANPEQEHMIEQVVQVCSSDNLELGCMLIEKAATEKALRDIDEALAGAFQTRRKHREQTGQPFYDMSIFNNSRYPSALPEPLRPKPGGLTPQQLMVYEAFQRTARQPVVAGNQGENQQNPNSQQPPQQAPPQQVGSMEAFASLANKLNSSVNNLLVAAGNRSGEVTFSMLPESHEVRVLVAEIKKIAIAAVDEICLSFAQSMFKQMYELTLNEPLRLESLIAVLESVAEGCPKLSTDVSTWITYAPMNTENERKLHRTVLLLLVRSSLVKIGELDLFIARSMDGGRNGVWVEFALHFSRTAVLERITSVTDLPHVIDSFTKIAQKQGNYKKSVNKLLDELRGNKGGESGEATVAAPVVAIVAVDGSEGMGVSDVASKAAEALALASRNDPPQTRQSVTYLLDYWIRVYNDTPGNEKAYAQYLQLLQQHGVGKSEENSERFFRASTELVVEAVLKSGQVTEGSLVPVLHYNVVDAYAKLVALLFKYMNSGGGAEKVAAQRINLLNKVLGITVRCLMASSENGKQSAAGFDQRPYFRLLMNLIQDLNLPDPQLDTISLQILGVFGSALHVIQPCVVPGFAFSWLELVSHRMFLPNLLLAKGQKGFGLAHQLLLDLFAFLEPYLKKSELSDSITTLYKGTLRVLLVLLHDFPEFLCEYHVSFVSVIPANCIQLRNIFLSAFPRTMTLPDPFTPNLKIDLLPEIAQQPRILSNITGVLGAVRVDIDNYLKTRTPANFMSELPGKMLTRGGEVNQGLMNALVVYVGMQAIPQLQQQNTSAALMHSPEVEILMKLLLAFDDKGRYTCLNAIANQLRFPNSHSHFFSCVLLFMFQEAKSDGIKEQITRVLLERLIVHRPHPWGLLITFIELIKNPRYNFWAHGFTRCAAEIERVFESVSRSCMSNGGDEKA